MSFPTVIVIGGGLAGLASAVALAESGCRVQLLEKRPFLGGRATSYLLPDGSHVDNCQHVTLGCCTNLADFYRRVGSGDKIRFYDRLHFTDRRGRRSTISSSPLLPVPLQLAPSFLRFAGLDWADKRGIARALLRIARSGGRPRDAEGVSMKDWLRREKQTAGAMERFWRVVLVSALDEELDRTDARYGVDVFWKAFLSNRDGFPVGIPTVPLSDLYRGCLAAVERRGGEVRSRCVVREMRLDGERVASLVLDDGTELVADVFLAAVPHDALLEILPAAFVEGSAVLRNLRNLRYAPITGIHLWFDRRVMQEPFLTLLDGTVQWVFNKSLLYGEGESPTGTKGQYLQLVVSASYDLIQRSRQEIIDLCLSELRDVLPATREATLSKATVIKEVSATFSPEPGSDRWRPGAESPLGNLWLAGDWTRTGWPATMEGAVRSGYLAAEAILARAGHAQKFLQPDLPPQGLCARWAQSAGNVE
ncbi:MAG TPA: hydroxysqualene dehydroxylase HpnE, partial [Candidatus Acidoferrales bacterium]|jgi:zeta-carotene desaturase|nr:hydroxysqualene dehydroxylase HpnE [Candidatus Acidoferrales bacterium]